MVKMFSRTLALATIATIAIFANTALFADEALLTSGPGGPVNLSTVTPVHNAEFSVQNDVPGIPAAGNIVLKPPVTEMVFQDFTKKCDTVVKELSDSRLTLYYNNLKVLDRTNINRPLTRAEFLKLVINSANIDVSNEADAPFADVPASHPLNKYIAYAARIGQISATQGNNFYPDAPISRAEAAKVFVNAAGLGESTMATTFADVSFDKTQLAGYIQSAYDNCLLHGQMENGSRVYNPFRNISLGEAVKVIFNVNYQR